MSVNVYECERGERGGEGREIGRGGGGKQKHRERIKECYFYANFSSFTFRDPTDPAEPPRVETLTYQSVLQNELLGKTITEVPVR
jgi:hypothetical protein